jgi:PAS domain S-box-containing protein
MNHKLRILFVEDESADHELTKWVLTKEGLDFDSVLVESENDFVAQLGLFDPDIIVSDYEMPVFKGTKALELAKNHNPSLPFIILTGSRNEEIAVECMRLGAWDYVIKDNMKRLPFALKEALHLAEVMHQKDAAIKAMAESEQKYRSYIDQASDGIFVIDENGIFYEVNPAACKMTGYTEEEILGMSVRDFTVDLANNEEILFFEKLKSTGDVTEELKFRRKNGSVGWWIASGHKISENRYIGYTKEITSMKLNQLSLIESEKKYKSLVSQMTQGLAVHEIIEDEDGNVIDYRFLDANESFELTTGLDRTYIIGRTVREVIPDIEPEWIEKYGKVAKTGEPIHFQQFSASLKRWYEVIAYRPQKGQFATIFTDITEQRQNLDALRSSEEKFRLIAEKSVDVIFVIDLDFNYLFISPSVERLIGYTVAENMAYSGTNFLSEKSRLELLETFQKELYRQANENLDRSRTIIYEAEIIHKDGHTIDVEFRFNFIYDENDIITGLTGVSRSITERKKAEEALKKSEEKYRLLIENSNDAIVVGLLDKLVFANPKAYAMLGYKEEMFFVDYINFIYPDDRQLFVDSYSNLVLHSIPLNKIQVRFINASNQINWIELTGVVIEWENQTAVLSFISDITERREAEDLLRISESSFRMLFENIPLGIFQFDTHGIITSVNDPFVKMIGSSIDKLIGLDLNKLPDLKMVDTIHHTLSGKRSSYEGLYKAVTSKKESEITGKFSPVFAEDGTVIGGIGIIDDVSIHKKAEQELHESQERFARSFYSSPAAISIIERESNVIIDVNDAWCRISGYERESVIGKKVDKIIRFDPESRHLLIEGLKTNNSVHEVEVNLFSRTNERITALTSIEMYEIGGIQYLLSTMMDITERKNAEEELIKLTRAVEQSPVSIIITDLDGTIDYVNPKASEVTGYLPAELIGKNPRIFSSGENQPEFYRQMYKILKAGGIWHGEFRNKTKTGELIWESASISPVINDKGFMTHYIAVKEDITEWKKMHEILQESEKRYRDMFMGNPLPMYIFDIEDHKFIEVNAATVREYGYSEDEFLSMKLEDIHEDGFVPIFIPGILENDTKKTEDNQSRHLRKDGTIVNVEISAHPIESANARRLTLILEKNITEKLNTEKALQHAKELAEASDKLKTTFLNNISHEVRTPLNGIIGAASLMADPELKGDDQEELVQIITTSTERLIQTITDFMDVSLLTSQNMEVFIRKVHLTKMLGRIKQKFEKQMKEKNLKFEFRLPENADSHILDCDEELIFKSLSHLMANAIKFNDKATVILGYQLKGDQVEFFVEDNGIGISKDSQSRIFDYFSQEDSSSVRRFEGSGLGLSIVKGIAALLGGSVRLVTAKGLGSSFFISFPAGSLSETEPPVAEIKKEKTGQPVLLIAEDDESNFFVLEVVIKKTTGAKVIRASNGIEAVDLCRENQAITLVLMDIKMPIMDGLEATREIKAFRPDLPIIAITAYAMSGDEQKALNAGCDDYLAKPVSMKSLVAKLEVYGLTKVNK